MYIRIFCKLFSSPHQRTSECFLFLYKTDDDDDDVDNLVGLFTFSSHSYNKNHILRTIFLNIIIIFVFL